MKKPGVMKTIDININERFISHIYQSLYVKLIKHLAHILPAFDPEAIHRFRVDYKKFRAFLRLILCLHNSTTLDKIPGKLRITYKASGVLRDLQMQEQRIKDAAKKEIKKPKVYIDFLSKGIEKNKKLLHRHIQKISVSKLTGQSFPFIPGELNVNQCMRYVENIFSEVYSVLLTDFLLDRELHAIRKRLKDLFYILEIFSKKEREQLLEKKLKGKGWQYFTELLEKLGDFQDRCTAIAILRSYSKCHFIDFSEELLNTLLVKWVEEKVYLKQMLVKKLKADFLVN
jgi:CHAD domain-containing protein